MCYNDFMSTTISPAFRVSAEADLFSVAEGLRATLIPYLSDKFRKEAVSMAITEFDSVEERDSDWDFSEFLKISLNHLRRNLTGDVETYDKYDLLPFRRILDFRAIFLRNKVRGETYVLLGEPLDKNGEALVLGVEGIESDFSYWNGSDSQLETMTEEEWETRKVSWGETIDRLKGIPEQGIVVKFFESISIHDLCGWKHYEGQSDSLVAELAAEARFRRLVFNAYLENLRKVYPDLDIMQTINGSWQFMNPKKELDFSTLPFAEEQQIRLENAISFAEERVTKLSLVF